MKLKEVAKQEFKGKGHEGNRLIGIYKEGEKIYPDWADEMIEIYGEKEVKDFQMVQKEGRYILVVEFA